MSYTLLEQIKIRLRQYDVTEVNGEKILAFNKSDENFILEQLIAKAKQDIISYRHYPDDYSQTEIDADIEANYQNTIIDLVLYDYSVEGADYEESHNENGVSRKFISKDKILGRIIPFCKVF